VNRSTYGNNQAVERAAAVLTPAVVVDRGRRDRPTHHDTSEVCNPPRGVVGYSVLCAGWRFFIISNHSGKRSFCRAELRSLEDPGARTRAVVHRNRKFADSPQERRVKSEPVPEVRFSGAGNSGLDSKTFMDDTGSAKAPFRGRISRNFDLVPRPTPPAMSS